MDIDLSIREVIAKCQERNQKSFPQCKNWKPEQWLQALIGEIGEYANIRKKFDRGDFSFDEFQKLAADEIADIFIYLVLMADNIGIDLAKETVRKFNQDSKKLNSEINLEPVNNSVFFPTGNCFLVRLDGDNLLAKTARAMLLHFADEIEDFNLELAKMIRARVEIAKP